METIKEQKIATYSQPGKRIQLLFIQTKENNYYQIRKNRKRIYSCPWENIARKQLKLIIEEEILQLNLNLC